MNEELPSSAQLRSDLRGTIDGLQAENAELKRKLAEAEKALAQRKACDPMVEQYVKRAEAAEKALAGHHEPEGSCRRDYPEVFKRRAEQSREIGCRLARLPNKVRIFLDELPHDDYSQMQLENISCGPECAPAAKPEEKKP